MQRGMNSIPTNNQRLLVSSSMKFIPAIATTFLSFSTTTATATATSASLSSSFSEEQQAVVVLRADRIRGVYFGALVADALCLGSHYEYDALKIRKAYNGTTIEKYMGPGEHMGGSTHGIGWGERNYHPGTKAGDQTDYGEYNVLVLEQLAKLATATHPNMDSDSPAAETTTTPIKPFTVEAFIPTWIARLSSGWKQWVCTQTKQTYQQIQEGVSTSKLGGNSNAMALRYAAMFGYVEEEDTLVDYALKTMFTHRETTALLGNEFFARVVYRLVHRSSSGDNNSSTMTPREAIDSVVTDMNNRWITQKVNQAIEKYEEAIDLNGDSPLGKEDFVDDLALTSMARLWDVGKSEPIKVGKASPTEGTLPGSIYFILKYQDNFVDAVKANAMVGGDNASRAIAIGMVLGAYHGIDGALHDHPSLRDGLNHWDDSEELLSKLPLLRIGEDDNDNDNNGNENNEEL